MSIQTTLKTVKVKSFVFKSSNLFSKSVFRFQGLSKVHLYTNSCKASTICHTRCLITFNRLSQFTSYSHQEFLLMVFNWYAWHPYPYNYLICVCCCWVKIWFPPSDLDNGPESTKGHHSVQTEGLFFCENLTKKKVVPEVNYLENSFGFPQLVQLFTKEIISNLLPQ
ncbi:hypothetical protein O6P43_023645 [Quillaja saponaria]|uniref:Uncharacterized protein n=1 Tax=Quillaja saponaria TaxID=32244 RepID=A0AAD7LFP3_QUISA|nr:hypothetical protein O6P43_023645 [Quillaja saponaria]